MVIPAEAPSRKKPLAQALSVAAAASCGLTATTLVAVWLGHCANEGLAGLRGLECQSSSEAEPPRVCRVEEGVWFNDSTAPVELRVISGDAVRLLIDERETISRKAQAKNRATRATVQLARGLHNVRVEKARAEQLVDIVVGPVGRDVSPLGPVFKEEPSPDSVRWARLALASHAIALWAVPLFIATAVVTGLVDGAGSIALAGVLLWGGLLRFESIVASRWQDPPEAARALASVGTTLRPADWHYPLEPYRGDPITYLSRGRQMTWFYDGSDREPLFVALVSVFVRLTGGRDVGVSFASAFSSLLLVAGGYSLARRLFGSRIALVTALFLALNQQLIVLSAQGWRDETFGAGMLMTLVAWLKLIEAPTRRNSLLAGLVAAWPFLTRLSALSFIAPALLMVGFIAQTSPWNRWRAALMAGLSTAVLVVPYLWSCWTTFGDPFRAINVHTLYYRGAETGIGVAQAENVTSYLFSGRDWIERADTAAAGFMEIAFSRTYEGLEPWLSAKGTSVATLLVTFGLASMAFSHRQAAGVLGLTLAASAPYAWTWPLGSGSDFRFTIHAVPVGVMASLWVLRVLVDGVMQRGAKRKEALIRVSLAVASLLVVAAARVTLHSKHLAREGEAGRVVFLTGGFLDGGLVRGFSFPYKSGAQFVRRSADGARIEASLKPNTSWSLTLRWWSERAVTVREGPHVVGILQGMDQSALGFAEFPLTASSARDRTIAFDGDVELWWARLTPMSGPHTPASAAPTPTPTPGR